ncbi:MAG TPA: HAD family hydrolase [Solirubrobacteraceae bacterium]|nr:HAD family hydrolase [Solirubrobacteraceae bacterium]
MKSEPFGPEVSAFLFDVGGTLYRSPDFDALVEDQAYVALADDRGCDLEEAKRLLKDRQAVNSEQLGDPTKVRALEDLGVRREVFQDAVAALDPAPYLSEAPSIGEFLGTLKQLGYKVGVLSNFKEALVRKVFACLGADWDDLDGSVCVDDGLPIKPDPEPFRVLCERVGTPPSQAVFVGDSVSKDLAPAKRLGMGTVLVGVSQTANTEGVVDHSVEALDDVLSLLSR